jgi:hypothetical protein
MIALASTTDLAGINTKQRSPAIDASDNHLYSGFEIARSLIE